MKYFVIRYGLDTGVAELLGEFNENDLDAAVALRVKLETETETIHQVEIVLLGSSSTETLRSTHGRYFKSEREILKEARGTSATVAS